MRFGLEIKDSTKLFESTELKFLKSSIEGGGKVGVLCVKNKTFSRSELDKLVDFAKSDLGAKGLLYIGFKEDGNPISTISKFLPSDFLQQAREIFSDVTSADTLFLVSDNYFDAWTVLGKLRKILGDKLNVIDKEKYAL